MKLSVITLTLNKLDYTKNFIESLNKYTKDFELIIVDNGSTDGTVEYIKCIPEIKLIQNSENLGFSKGNNQGIEVAKGEYIGFLNNDILLYPNWFEACEKVFECENAGFVSPRHINPHYDNTNPDKYIKYFQAFHYDKPYEKSFDECVFSCVITKREVLDEIGVFDEKFFPAFFEDNDLKYRAIEAGYGIYVTNEAGFYHFGSVTSVKHSQNMEKNRAYYYSKHPLAEYLSISGAEKFQLQRMAKQFKVFPLNKIYAVHLMFIKLINRLKKITGVKKA